MQTEYIYVKLIETTFLGVGAIFYSVCADLRRIVYTRGCACVCCVPSLIIISASLKNVCHNAKTLFLIVDNAKLLKEIRVVFASATHVIAPCSQQLQLSTCILLLQARTAYLNTFRLSLWPGLKQRTNIFALVCTNIAHFTRDCFLILR